MLKVNEIFGPTIQGEGKSAGMPVMFLRLATCNLHCRWCDTAYTWRFNDKFPHDKNIVYKREDEVHEMSVEEVFQALMRMSTSRALVISGGEPLIQQKQLIELVALLKTWGWWIEIETNGTIAPSDDINPYIDQFNCSPKLSNSGDRRELRVRAVALHKFAENPKVYFKFVVANEKDIEEIIEYVQTYNMTRVYLMPLGMTREELNETRSMTQELCAKYKFTFSDRLHVVQWGNVRGV